MKTEITISASVFLFSLLVLVPFVFATCDFTWSSCRSTYCGDGAGCDCGMGDTCCTSCDCNEECGSGKCSGGVCVSAGCPSTCSDWYNDCYKNCGKYYCWGESSSSMSCKGSCATAGQYASSSSDCCSGLTYSGGICISSISAPTMATIAATNIGGTVADIHGKVTNDGGATTSAKLVWGDTSSYGSASGWGQYDVGVEFGLTISGLTKGKTYHFRSEGQNSAGSGYGGDATFITKPDAPTGFTATVASATQINLAWSKGAGASSTVIRRSTTGYPATLSDGILVDAIGGTSYSDGSLNGGTTYYYSIWSYASEEGLSIYSDNYATVVATTTGTCVGTVSLSLTPFTVSPSQTFTASVSGLSGCSDKTAYFYLQNGANWDSKGTCTITDTGCHVDITAPVSTGDYTYKVSVDKNGDSDYADTGESITATLTVESGSCDQKCRGQGYQRGACTTNGATSSCEQGNTVCEYNRLDYDAKYSDNNCGLMGVTQDCWCFDQQACNACDKAPACTVSGCVPTKITNAGCVAGKCSNPCYACVYLKEDTSGYGESACIVGSTSPWEGQTCSNFVVGTCGCTESGCWSKNSATAVCPSLSTQSAGTECHIRLPCAGGTATVGSGGACWNSVSQYVGMWSNYNYRAQCVRCAGLMKVQILGDAKGIYVNCDGSGSGPNAGTCSLACGAPDPLCDDKAVGASCGSGGTCNNDCNCITPPIPCSPVGSNNVVCISKDSAKPNCCSDGLCHECCSDTDCVASSKVCTDPASTYKKCQTNPTKSNLYTCSICGPCQIKTDCESDYCCSHESSPGPYEIPGRCLLQGTVMNPYLCN